MATKFPKGSMGAAEDKEQFRFRAIATVLIVAVFLVNYVFNTDLKTYAQGGGAFTHFASYLCYGVAIAALWASDRVAKWDWLNADSARWIAFIGLGLGIGFSGGFHGL